jgi:GH15 family glucan-1,4-alpha-glucosidase
VPWVSHTDGLLTAVAGPDAVSLWTPVELEGRDMATRAAFQVHEGASIPFVLSWYPSHQRPPRPIDGRYAVSEAERWWTEWSSRCTYQGRWRDAVMRSLLTLKVLTYAPTGGIVAAVTTSLPEQLGGARNWDYRYCWVRDATLTLRSLLAAGYREEAESWRDWLLRSAAGDPADLQIMYGPAGERRLDEMEVPWLSGYEGSRPVRIGNAAAGQFQLDVYGELMDSLHAAREVGINPEGPAWSLQEVVLEWLEGRWRDPDDGIWEVRGPRRHFTHSKIMAWVAFDRAVRAIEHFGLPGPLDRWRAVRDEIHAEVCAKGWNPKVKAFTQYYGSDELDASVLMMLGVGFLPPSDERVVATVEAIASQLTSEGFVLRYDTETGSGVDGLEGREGAFLACSFWMVDALGAIGRRDEAKALFERLVGLANDVGLLAEEYDPSAKRQVGNFPQAFSHVSLINSALTLDGCAPWSPANQDRSKSAPEAPRAKSE